MGKHDESATHCPVWMLADKLHQDEPDLFPYVPRMPFQNQFGSVQYFTGMRSDWYSGRHREPNPDAIILEPTWPVGYRPGTSVKFQW